MIVAADPEVGTVVKGEEIEDTAEIGVETGEGLKTGGGNGRTQIDIMAKISKKQTQV